MGLMFILFSCPPPLAQAFWHIADIPTCSTNVRFCGVKQTWIAAAYCAVACLMARRSIRTIRGTKDEITVRLMNAGNRSKGGEMDDRDRNIDSSIFGYWVTTLEVLVVIACTLIAGWTLAMKLLSQ
jgi:hypothetical protein